MCTSDRFKAEAERARQRAKEEASGASSASKNLVTRTRSNTVLREAGSSGTSASRTQGEGTGSTGGTRGEEQSPGTEAGSQATGGGGEEKRTAARSSQEDEDAQRQRMLLQVLTNASKASAHSRSQSPGISGGGGAGHQDTPILSVQLDTPLPSPVQAPREANLPQPMGADGASTAQRSGEKDQIRFAVWRAFIILLSFPGTACASKMIRVRNVLHAHTTRTRHKNLRAPVRRALDTGPTSIGGQIIDDAQVKESKRASEGHSVMSSPASSVVGEAASGSSAINYAKRRSR
jgi:hypothetical protein